MATKNDLTFKPSPSDFSSITSLDSWFSQASHRALVKEEELVLKAARKQSLEMKFMEAKQHYAEIAIGRLHRTSNTVYVDTIDCIMGNRERPGRSKEHQSYIDQFSHYQIELLGQHLLTLTEMGIATVSNISQERPYSLPEPEPEPEPPVGWVRRTWRKVW